MQQDYDIIICGGGLSGLWAAIELSHDCRVLVIDPDDYPRHRMCGEYLSAEVTQLLESQGIELSHLTNVAISDFEISLRNGKTIQSPLPLGGYGISRYHLDHHLYQILQGRCDFLKDKVLDVEDNVGHQVVTVKGRMISCKQVIVATGKRSTLDKKLNRDFIKSKSSWLAVKMHYSYDMPTNKVELHNFKGGYAGLSKVENGAVNLCYLAHYDSFKPYKDIVAFEKEVLCENPHLKCFFENATALWEKPIAISQISFGSKDIARLPFLYIGDTAGLIHPLCGNGMAMAMHSAHLAATAVKKYLNKTMSKEQMIATYAQQWQWHFSKRLKNGSYIQSLLMRPRRTRWVYQLLSWFPFVLPMIIRQTHGKMVKL